VPSQSDEYGCHPCGEGGEYETLTLDCPLFRYRIVLYVDVLLTPPSVRALAAITPTT
jgi:diphthamide synthase (EF-2-diphthine--ammonia ligase)